MACTDTINIYPKVEGGVRHVSEALYIGMMPIRQTNSSELLNTAIS